jgi:hypothetical protein
MTQLVIGAALGFIVGECLLQGLKYAVRFLQREKLGTRLGGLTTVHGFSRLSGPVRHALVFAAVAAVVTLAAWAVTDYLAARAAQRAAKASVASLVTPPPSIAPVVADEDSESTDDSADSAEVTPADRDPYADEDFKVRRHARHSGRSRDLTETLLERSEAKARTDLLAETQAHAQRSQYDCESAERAKRYLKAGLDVWGFAAWQSKYFPVDGYKGATLAQCKAIPNRTDGSQVNLEANVAAEGRAGEHSSGR